MLRLMLYITDSITLQDWELTESFMRASGPGGQNVNKVSSLKELIQKAVTPPKRRIATRPTLGSKKRRLKAKKERGEVKAMRGKVDPE